MGKSFAWVTDLIFRGDGGRFTQDSPVLPDVWLKYVQEVGKPVDLLITPFQDPAGGDSSAGRLGVELLERLRLRGETAGARVSYHQTALAATLGFLDLVQVVLPMSRWWAERIERSSTRGAREPELDREFDLRRNIWRPREVERLAIELVYSDESDEDSPPSDVSLPPRPEGSRISAEVLWLVRVVGLIGCVHKGTLSPRPHLDTARGEVARLGRVEARLVANTAAEILQGVVPVWYDPRQSSRMPISVYTINLNRRARSSIHRSGVAVKSDAVNRLFAIDTSSLNWAVIDGGIDATHPAFRRRTILPDVAPGGEPPAADRPRRERPFREPFEVDKLTGRVRNRTRIVATYDFTIIRKLLRIDLFESGLDDLPDWVRMRINPDDATKAAFRDEVEQLQQSLKRGRELDWGLLGELIRVDHDDKYAARFVPKRSHGTHVAGIIGADWRAEDGCPIVGGMRGICPTINLYDLRVIDDRGESDEFSVMAALQFARSLNAHKEIMSIHGVNLSLSIRHEVRNYACGRTPICDECERLVGAGIVVVTAAGNNGYNQRGAEASLGDTYQSMSITDPGNAEGVITVGSTHREKPHQYGVSYFSSRGPTGDGRAKPDLVAPGEKIESTAPGGKVATMDGTSQAAPHVSGAAALLMARHVELVGRPAEVKRILCESATDLGRYRFFQGSGMLDILRAIQSV